MGVGVRGFGGSGLRGFGGSGKLWVVVWGVRVVVLGVGEASEDGVADRERLDQKL